MTIKRRQFFKQAAFALIGLGAGLSINRPSLALGRDYKNLNQNRLGQSSPHQGKPEPSYSHDPKATPSNAQGQGGRKGSQPTKTQPQSRPKDHGGRPTHHNSSSTTKQPSSSTNRHRASKRSNFSQKEADNSSSSSQRNANQANRQLGLKFNWSNLRLSVPNVDLPDQLAFIPSNTFRINNPNYLSRLNLLGNQTIELELLLLIQADGNINIYRDPIKISRGAISRTQARKLIEKIEKLSWPFTPTKMAGDAIDQEYYAQLTLITPSSDEPQIIFKPLYSWIDY
ncbi:MAG: hypothetical protein HC796_11610 [Synechococcaceae cyanobacterium RL_1_2]|nr:hypothetical protein [Synechococcaceae cyanobacterium RL_1_2]